MSREQKTTFDRKILSPQVARKQILEVGKVNRTPPEVGIFDSPKRCFVVNVEWWAHIAGMVHWLADVASWQDAEDENYFAIREILKFMQGVECMDFQLRQSPDDFCIMQQSIDGGTTWTDVFDFSLCTSIVDGSSDTTVINQFATYVTQFTENIYNEYVENYIDSVTDIHPELGYGDADDGNRNSALCYALGKLVDSVCIAANEFFDGQSEVADDVKVNLALAGAIVGIVILGATGIGLPAATVMAISLSGAGLGIAASLGAALYDHYIDTNQSAYNDEDAKHEVVCCLLDVLEDANVDHADLIAAFSCAGLSTNAQAVHDAAAILVQELATYAAFTENMAIGFQSAKLGLLPACPCDVGTWCFEWDFAVSTNTWTQNVGIYPYTESGTTGFGSTSPNPCIIEIERSISEYVSSVEIEFFGVGSGGNNLKIYNDATLLYDGTFVSFFAINANVGTLKIRSQRGFAYGIGAVQINGVGTNPFGVDNC